MVWLVVHLQILQTGHMLVTEYFPIFGDLVPNHANV